MLRKRKRGRKALLMEDNCSFGSALDEIGWKPTSESIRLRPRVEKTINQVRAEFDRALSAVAAERRFGGPNVVSTEIEILEKAAELVRTVLKTRSRRSATPISTLQGGNY